MKVLRGKHHLQHIKGRSMGKKSRFRLVLSFLLVIAVLCFTFVIFHRSDLIFRSTYQIESTSEMSFGVNGQTLVIDNGKKNLLALSAEGELLNAWEGGSDDAPFYYAVYAVQNSDGRIYVADIKYGDRGNLLDRERILLLDGNNSEVLYELDYTKWAQSSTPLQYGRILELQAYEGAVYFLLDTGKGIELKEIDADGSVKDIAGIPADGVKNDASYDVKKGQVVVVNRNGEMSIFSLDGGEARPVEISEGLMPYDVAARNGEVYFTELLERGVWHFSIDDPDAAEAFCTLEEFPFKLDVSQDGRDVLATDQVGFYRLSGSEQHTCLSTEYVDEARFAYFGRIILTWALLAIGSICVLIMLLRLIADILIAAMKNENGLRILLIIVAVLSVSFVLAYTLMNQLLTVNTDSSEGRVALFSDLLQAELDKDALLTLDAPADHGSDAFKTLKEPLDRHTWESYDREDYFYYILYRSIGGNVVMVMDFEDTMPCTRPMYIDDPEDNIYSEVLHKGDPIQVTEISSYGAWSFLLTPVYGEDGSIIAELEVGQSLDQLQRKQKELTRELIINAVVCTIVIAMLLLELTFLITFLKTKRGGGVLDNTDRIPVRTLMFLSYLADSMQDAFIAILCTQLYKGGLPVSDSVAVALPMSAQLLMMAVFSLFAGRFAERYGSRISLTGGMLVQLSGLLCCLVMGSYSGLLIGKMLIGAGMGIVYVSCNTVAATGSTGEKSATAFAAVSAGTLSGLTIGAGLSSVLLSMGGWRLIYLIGAVIVGLGAVLAGSCTNVRLGTAAAEEQEKQSVGFGKFFFKPRVIGFFLLMLLPFMMALSYREYFFPLFASEHGIGEVRIGQVYLLCGMIVIYIGPVLSSWLLKKLGAQWSIVLASGLMGVEMLLFVIWPTIVSVIAGVVILSVVISFAYTCQYSYFEQTPESKAYGEGRAMGVYSVFESLGQTVGPVAYGLLLTFGYQSGITVFCLVMFAMLLVFVALMLPSGIRYRSKSRG